MMQVTFAALYGKKTQKFSEFITDVQRKVSDMLKLAFSPYHIEQVHSTIIGLEYIGESINYNYSKFRHEMREMNFEGFLHMVKSPGQFPITVKVGGFENREYSFRSHGGRPYLRTLAIQKNKVIIAGWPTKLDDDGLFTFPPILDNFRTACQKYNILHKYHKSPNDFDNDFHFCIGTVDTHVAIGAIKEKVESELQYQLAQSNLFLEINLGDLDIISYHDPTLPLGTTTAYSITEVNPAFLRHLTSSG